MPTGDPFKKVRTGDKLRIPFDGLQCLHRCGDGPAGARQSTSSQDTPTFRQAGIVTVKNCTGGACERFNVLGIDDPIFLRDENEQSFKNRVMFDGVTPADPDHKGKFVILLEPLSANAIGLACIDGVCPAQVTLPDDEDSDDPSQYADMSGGDTSALLAGKSGGAQIIWIDPELSAGETGWAVVRLGLPLPKDTSVKPCLVKRVGGSDGDWGSYASWTYNIYALTDTGLSTPLATGLPVDNSPARIFMGPGVAPAETGSVGLYYKKPDDSLGLHTVAEKIAMYS